MSASALPLRAASERFRRFACATLLFALVLTQTLGLVHRIVHAPIGGHPAISASASASSTTSTGMGWLKALFAGHSSEQGCDLYDQLSHADAVPAASTAAVLVHAFDLVLTWHSVGHLAAQAAGFLARGPPSAG